MIAYYPAGATAAELWNYLLTNMTVEDSGGWAARLGFPEISTFDDLMTRRGLDADVWTTGADGVGTITCIGGGPTNWRLRTGNVINNDTWMHGDTCIHNKMGNPADEDRHIVIWEARLQLETAALISAFWGLVFTALTDYAEPNAQSAHFFADPVVSANIQARTWETAEEQSDTGIAIDALYHTYRIEWEAAEVRFYIDDALVATHDTRIPYDSLYSNFLIRTEAAAGLDMFVEHCRMVTL